MHNRAQVLADQERLRRSTERFDRVMDILMWVFFRTNWHLAFWNIVFWTTSILSAQRHVIWHGRPFRTQLAMDISDAGISGFVMTNIGMPIGIAGITYLFWFLMHQDKYGSDMKAYGHAAARAAYLIIPGALLFIFGMAHQYVLTPTDAMVGLLRGYPISTWLMWIAATLIAVQFLSDWFHSRSFKNALPWGALAAILAVLGPAHAFLLDLDKIATPAIIVRIGG